MHKTRTRKTRPRKRRTRKGGSRYFYPYNKTPIIFTNTSKQQGGFLGVGDPRYTLLPGPASDTITNVNHSLSNSVNAYSGNYQGITPNWRFQPLK